MIDLEELERLEQAAPGPWFDDGSYRVRTSDDGGGICLVEVKLLAGDGRKTTELIVAARNALPELIHEVRLLRAALLQVALVARDAAGAANRIASPAAPLPARPSRTT